jgi:hypothetical protein
MTIKEIYEELKNDIKLKVSIAPINIRLGECYQNNRYWAGSIDEFAFFNKVLSVTEISNLYNTNIKKISGINNS